MGLTEGAKLRRTRRARASGMVRGVKLTDVLPGVPTRKVTKQYGARSTYGLTKYERERAAKRTA